MIHRTYILCQTCLNHFTLRIQIGYGEKQTTAFHCHFCKEPIEVTLNMPGGFTYKGAIETKEKDETNYQYLSPDFVADEADSRNPRYFGSMEFMDKILKKGKPQERITKLNIDSINNNAWIALRNAKPDWDALKVSWRLARNSQHYIALTKLVDYLKKSDLDETDSPWLAVNHLGTRMFHIEDKLMHLVVTLSRTHPEYFSSLVTSYQYDWKSDFRNNQFSLFNKFFDQWDSFSQVHTYIKLGIEIPQNAQVASLNYEATLSFYAAAQEFYAKQIVIYTVLNNILSGRKFDALQNIPLKIWMSSDNAKRRENFKAHFLFDSLSSEYDSGLRNAVAHNWVNFDPKDNKIRYLEGGKGNLVEIPYPNFLMKCVKLFKQICILMQAEYLFEEAARRDAADFFRPRA